MSALCFFIRVNICDLFSGMFKPCALIDTSFKVLKSCFLGVMLVIYVVYEVI